MEQRAGRHREFVQESAQVKRSGDADQDRSDPPSWRSLFPTIPALRLELAWKQAQLEDELAAFSLRRACCSPIGAAGSRLLAAN